MDYQRKQKYSVVALSFVIAMIFTMIIGVANVHADTEYTYQPVIPEGENMNSLFMIKPSDITVVEETDDYIVNKINSTIDGTQNITFTCTMSAGMNNFSESNFLQNNMPIIKILDKSGNVAAQYSNGMGDLKFKGSAKSDQINNHGGQKTIEFYIGVDAGILSTGDYTLVFGKNLCGNNTSKILGKDIKFDFYVKATPDLEILIDEVKTFLQKAEIGQNPGQYPQQAAEVFQEAIDKAETDLKTIKAELDSGKITLSESKEKKNEVAKKLSDAWNIFKTERIVDIKEITVKGIGDSQYVGDDGILSADVAVEPNESEYKKIKWEASDNIIIDEVTGEWIAAYAGDGWIRAVSKTDSTKYKEVKVAIRNEKDTVGVMLSEGAVPVIDAVSNAYDGELSEITSLKLFTMDSGKVDSNDIAQIHIAMPNLKVLNLKNVSLTAIGNSWFANWTGLEKIVLPDNLASINIKAFYNCSSLKEVVIPVNVNNIGSSAFAGCTSLNSTLTVMSAAPPTFTTSVFDDFGDSFRGTETDQAASVTTIQVPYGCAADYKAATGWKRYKIVEMEENALEVTYDTTGELSAVASKMLEKKGWKDDEVTFIKVSCKNGAYLDKTTDIAYLQTHFLGATTVDLSEAAFPDNNIQSDTFKERKNAKEIILPEGVTHMGRQAFYGCSNLRSMTIPSTVRYSSKTNPGIGESAFGECNKLTTIIFKCDVPPGYAGSLPANLTNVYVPNLLVDDYKEAYSDWRNIIKEQSTVTTDAEVSVEAMQTKQLTATVDSVVDLGKKLKWEITTSQSNDNPVASIDEKTGLLSGCRYGTVTVKVTAGAGTMNECSAECKVTVTKAPAVKLTVTSSAYNSTKLSWSAMSGAEGYQVFRATSSKGTYKALKTVKTRSFTDSGLTTGKTYYYKVRGYKTIDGRRVYGEYSSVKSGKPSLGKVTSVKAAKGGTQKVKVSWKKVSGASGYVVYQSTKKSSGFKAVKTVKGNSTVKYTTVKLKKGKTYYFKVKAYRTVSKKKVYSPSYSSVVKYKVK